MKVIFAHDTRLGFSKNGQIPWDVPGDLAFFRETTVGGTVIMGRNTWESLPRALSKRMNVVVSSSLKGAEGATIVGSLDEALAIAQGECFVIGGVGLILEALDHPKCEGAIVSVILGNYNCDQHATRIFLRLISGNDYLYQKTLHAHRDERFIVDYFARIDHVQKS